MSERAEGSCYLQVISTGTIERIIDRLPEALQNQWVKRSSKIINMGREPTFQDLTSFV